MGGCVLARGHVSSGQLVHLFCRVWLMEGCARMRHHMAFWTAQRALNPVPETSGEHGNFRSSPGVLQLDLCQCRAGPTARAGVASNQSPWSTTGGEQASVHCAPKTDSCDVVGEGVHPAAITLASYQCISTAAPSLSAEPGSSCLKGGNQPEFDGDGIVPVAGICPTDM